MKRAGRRLTGSKVMCALLVAATAGAADRKLTGTGAVGRRQTADRSLIAELQVAGATSRRQTVGRSLIDVLQAAGPTDRKWIAGRSLIDELQAIAAVGQATECKLVAARGAAG